MTSITLKDKLVSRLQSHLLLFCYILLIILLKKKKRKQSSNEFGIYETSSCIILANSDHKILIVKRSMIHGVSMLSLR